MSLRAGTTDMGLQYYQVRGPIPSCVDTQGVVHAVMSSGTIGGRTECGVQFAWKDVADSLFSGIFASYVDPVAKIDAAVTCLRCAAAR